MLWVVHLRLLLWVICVDVRSVVLEDWIGVWFGPLLVVFQEGILRSVGFECEIPKELHLYLIILYYN